MGHCHYYGLKLAKVTPVHLFYTLVAFYLLLAKQTFLFLHTFMLILWFLKLDSGSYRPVFPRQLRTLSAAAVWQTDNKAFQFTSLFFFFFYIIFFKNLFLLHNFLFFPPFYYFYFSQPLSFKNHIIN